MSSFNVADLQPDPDASLQLAEFVATTSFDHLPSGVVTAVKKSILLTLGACVGGYALGLGHKALAGMMVESGGAGEATIIGLGARVPAWSAALANSATARALNLEDFHDKSLVHPGGCVIPAALAAAQRKKGVSGKEFIAAVALGSEIICRMSESIQSESGQPRQRNHWFLGTVFGAFGAAAAAGKALRLDAEMIRNAFGIVLFESSGTLEAFAPSAQSAMMRGMVTGFAAKSGVLASLMSERGITGVPDALEGEHGFFASYFPGQYSRSRLLAEIGTRWASETVSLKAYPTCRYTHSYIDSTIQLAKQHDIQASDIEEIGIHVSGHVATRCQPLAQQRRPTNFNHAGHAMPFLIAAAARRRRITVEDLLAASGDLDTQSLAERVVPRHDPRFGSDDRIGPALVEIVLRDGSRYRRETQVAYGDPRHPVSTDEVLGIFRQLMGYASPPLSSVSLDELIVRLGDLENEVDVSDLVAAMH